MFNRTEIRLLKLEKENLEEKLKNAEKESEIWRDKLGALWNELEPYAEEQTYYPGLGYGSYGFATEIKSTTRKNPEIFDAVKHVTNELEELRTLRDKLSTEVKALTRALAQRACPKCKKKLVVRK